MEVERNISDEVEGESVKRKDKKKKKKDEVRRMEKILAKKERKIVNRR